ncbi:MAG: hypothetical protein IT376_08785 [Polyangiaceae bacterium]|nr:hypothetical protein [Polyangiaceae bacterium]
MRLFTLTRLSLVSLGLIAAFGCAEEREPISRVQPNALDKTFFVGNLADATDDPAFYSRAFVIDQTANQTELSVGLYSGTDKIRWEIGEDYLVAHKAYQIVRGQDDKGLAGQPADGTIVARYRILGHFDIKRAYNPTTGEELNVIEENGSDRPWYQRQYMRVDWSTNDIADPMWFEMTFGKLFGDTTVLPRTYAVTDPTHEHAPYFDTADGYFDVTNKYYTAPSNTYFEPWGISLPTCALVGLFTGTVSNDCNEQESTVRHSFWKLKPDHSFEPTENTLRPLDVIANFGGAGDSFQPGFAGGTTQCWDPQYAFTEECFHKYLTKVNVWANSHTQQLCNSDFDGNQDGTADQCENASVSKGSRCDLYHGKCTLALRDRSVKTVGFWMNKETPASLLDELDANGNPAGALDARGRPQLRGAMEDVIESWDQVMAVALAYGREAECRRTGDGSRDQCHQAYFEVDGGGQDVTQMISFGGWGIPTPKALAQDAAEVFTSCHAPVRAYDDHETCGPTGEIARNGDQRKNFIFYWPWDADAPYGGVAGLGQDPETGESHGVTATVMGRSATRAAAQYRDYIQIAMGDISFDEYAAGLPTELFHKLLENGFSPNSDSARRARGETIEYPADPTAAPAADGHATHGRTDTAMVDPKVAYAQLRELLAAQIETTADPAVSIAAQGQFDALASRLRGTVYEAELVDPKWAKAMLGTDPRVPVSEAALEASSPLRNMDPGRLQQWRATMAGKLAERGVCHLEDGPRVGSINFQGIMRWYLDKFEELGLDTDLKAGTRDLALVKKRGEYIYADLYKQMAKGIAIHEVGHCIGMRHNFSSSWDAPNYMPQYWQLRTNEGQSAELCTGAREAGTPDSCLGPRYLDPETEDEQGLAPRDGTTGLSNGRPGVTYFGNTSVMEYETDYLSPGMGTYDLAYVKAVYGGVIETYDIDHADRGGVEEAEQERFVANIGLELSELTMLDDQAAHYTQLAQALKVYDPSYCRAATQEELARGEWRVVKGKICTQSPRDHYFWRDFASDDEAGAPPSLYADILNFSFWRTKTEVDGGRLHQRWNYRYGETYGTGYMHTNPSDSGGDVFEVVTNTSKMFDYTYPVSYLRRKNKEYAPITLSAQVADRYFERMRAYHWVLEGNDSYLAQFPIVYQGYQQAKEEVLYTLMRGAMAPQPGNYVTRFDDAGKVVYDASDSGGGGLSFAPDFQVGLIDGRFVEDDYSNELGGEWDYGTWLEHEGYDVERGLAIRALVDGRPTLSTISRETYLDGRNNLKNFRSDFKIAVDRFLGGLLAEDWETTAPWVVAPGPTAEGGLAFASPQLLPLAASSPTRPVGSVPVFPNIGYKSQLATVVFAHLFARLNTDMELVNKLRVYIDGLDHLGAVPDADQVRFTDPGSGFTYVAIRGEADTVAGKAIDRGVGSRMLAHANALLAKAYTVQRDGSNQPILDQYGRPTLLSSGPVDGVAWEGLRRYVGLVDATRQVGRHLDGPLDAIAAPN